MSIPESDLQFLLAKYTRAANRFKPTTINTLLVLESPPSNLERFFYFEEVKQHDSLFLEVMGILYPDQKKAYLASGRDADLKTDLLDAFKEDGYWLMNLCQIPGTLFEGNFESLVPPLIERIKKEIDKKTPIILIKASVYDLCYEPLTSRGFNVYPDRIPFPGSGQQGVFRQKFQKAVTSV